MAAKKALKIVFHRKAHYEKKYPAREIGGFLVSLTTNSLATADLTPVGLKYGG